MKKFFDKLGEFFFIQGEIIWISCKRFFHKEDFKHAVVLTYYTLFAIVPIFALLFGIAKGFNFGAMLKSFIAERFSEQQNIVDWIYKFADNTLKNANGGIIAGIGILILFATAVRLAIYVESSFNLAWQVKKGRNFFRKISDFLSLVFVAPILFVALSSSALLIKNSIANASHHDSIYIDHAFNLIILGIEILPIAVSWLVFTCIYMYVPNTKVKILPAIFAGFFAALLYQAAQALYIAIQLKLSAYNSIYGSLSALPLFLMWLQWSWLITLFGNQLSYVCQNFKSGQFKKNLDKISHELSLKYTLAVCKIIVDGYEESNQKMSIDNIVEISKLPLVRVQDAIYQLLDAELIHRIDRDNGQDLTYMPAITPDKLTLELAMNKLAQAGYNDDHNDNSDIFITIDKYINNINLDIKNSKNNKLMRDL